MEKFLEQWNSNMSQFPLDPNTLKDPAIFFEAYIEVLKQIGLNTEAILSGYGDAYSDEHTEYYVDLLPIINIARVANHLLTEMGSKPTTISQLLTPNHQSIISLAILHNYLLFINMQMNSWESCHKEIELMEKQFQEAETERNTLLDELNRATAEKAMRPQRIKKLEEEEKSLKNQLKTELELLNELKESLKVRDREFTERNANLEQKYSQREAMLAELLQVNSQLVIDGSDIRFKVEQAELKEQVAIEKLDGMTEALKAKEETIGLFKSYKSKFDEANSLLDSIEATTKAIDALKTCEPNEAETEAAILQEQKAIAELEKSIRDLEEEELKDRSKNIEEADAALDAANSELSESQKYSKEVDAYVEEAKRTLSSLQEKNVKFESERVALLRRRVTFDDQNINEIKQLEKEILQMIEEEAAISKAKINKRKNK